VNFVNKTRIFFSPEQVLLFNDILGFLVLDLFEIVLKHFDNPGIFVSFGPGRVEFWDWEWRMGWFSWMIVSILLSLNWHLVDFLSKFIKFSVIHRLVKFS